MSLTLAEIAEAVEGQVRGDAGFRVSRLAHPAEAREHGDLVILLDPARVPSVAQLPVRAAVLPEGIDPPEGSLAGWVAVEKPRYALAALVALFERPPGIDPGVHPTAVIDPTAEIGPEVAIGPLVAVGPGARIGARCRILPHAWIGTGAELGPDCLIHSGARIGERVRLGERVILQPGAILGADGFSYVTRSPASFEAARTGGDFHGVVNEPVRRIGSLGRVEIGDDVEIGAGTCVDRSNIGATRIGARTKIDNMVQVAHNVTVGEDCLISGKVGIAGSVVIGTRAVIGGGALIADHVTVGDDAVVAGGAGVWRSVEPGQFVMGSPAHPKTTALAIQVNLLRLGRLLRDVRGLAGRVMSLERGPRPEADGL